MALPWLGMYCALLPLCHTYSWHGT
jgi:hypothetical protein